MRARSIPFLVSILLGVAFSPRAALADDPPTYADRASDDDDEDDPERHLAVLFNPLGTAVGVYGGEVDFAVARHVVLAVEGAFYRVDNTTARSLGAGVQLFPFRSAFHGIYLFPRFAYARASTYVDDSTSVDTNVFGLGGTVGYQWTFDYGFSLRLGGGVMWFNDLALAHVDPTQPHAAIEGVRPVLDASIGWAF